MNVAIIFLGILCVPCILFTIFNIVSNKYKNEDNKKKLSGFEVAREILDEHNLKDIYIVEVKESFNDHYDYNSKVVKLSSEVFHGETIYAAIIASRIASYAVQDKENYTFMKFRGSLYQMIMFANYVSYIIFVVALCIKDSSVLSIANLVLSLVLFFHLITLPVEFDACNRAVKYMNKYNHLTKKELEEANMLVKVSSYTFIMSMITCISNLVSEIVYNIQRRG